MLSTVLEQIDEAIYEKVKPQCVYQVKETACPCTLVTTFGEITFCRWYYQQKEMGCYSYLMDKWCHLPTYSRIEASCQARMADHVKNMSYTKAAQGPTGSGKQTERTKRIVPVGCDPEYSAFPTGT